MNQSDANGDKRAERVSAMNRRRFLKGLGACIALPAMESLVPRGVQTSTAPGATAASGVGAAETPAGAPPADRGHLLSQWRDPG